METFAAGNWETVVAQLRASLRWDAAVPALLSTGGHYLGLAPLSMSCENG